MTNLGRIMTSVFYLCAVAGYHHRAYGEEGVRLRCKFPRYRWFVDLVKSQGFQNLLEHDNKGTTPSFQLVGLVRCTAGAVASDVFTGGISQQELDVWQGYWSSLSPNFFTVNLQDVFVFDAPQQVYTHRDQRWADSRPLHGKPHPLAPFTPGGVIAEDMLALPGKLLKRGRQVSRCNVSDALEEFESPLACDLLALPVLEPVASLILKQSWQSIGMLGFWPLPRPLFEDFPPPEVKQKAWGAGQVHWSEDLSAENITRHLERLRSWAPAILQEAGSNEEDDVDCDGGSASRLEVADTLQWLDRLRRNMITHSQVEKPARYESSVLIASVFLASRLGSRKYMGEVVPLSLKFALPGVDLRELAKSTQFPRGTTLARASTYLDFSFLLHSRESWSSSQHVFYAWADSSGQSSREWLMVMHSCVASDALLQTYRAVNKLTRCRPDLSDHHEAEDLELQEYVDLNKVVFANLFHRKCVPVAMGQGQTKLERKASAFLHATGLECESREHLDRHLSCFASWTTDLGTEVQLPQLKALGVETVLPEWFHKPLEVDDVDADENPAPPINFQGPQMPAALLPQCLIVPGCLHIIHNLTQDVHEKMTWFDTFWQHLQPVTKLLAERPLRERFIATCVRGTAAAEHEEAFASAG